MIRLMAVLLVLLSSQTLLAVGPPKGFRWGMTYQETEEIVNSPRKFYTTIDSDLTPKNRVKYYNFGQRVNLKNLEFATSRSRIEFDFKARNFEFYFWNDSLFEVRIEMENSLTATPDVMDSVTERAELMLVAKYGDRIKAANNDTLSRPVYENGELVGRWYLISHVHVFGDESMVGVEVVYWQELRPTESQVPWQENPFSVEMRYFGPQYARIAEVISSHAGDDRPTRYSAWNEY